VNVDRAIGEIDFVNADRRIGSQRGSQSRDRQFLNRIVNPAIDIHETVAKPVDRSIGNAQPPSERHILS
jgi:hypothetical protein